MDGVGAGDLGGGDDARDVQVGLPPRGRTDADVVIGKADVQRFAVRFAVDRDGLNPQLTAGTNHSQRDLAAIGDEDFIEHSAGSRGAHQGVTSRVIPCGTSLAASAGSEKVRSDAAVTPAARSPN